MGALNLVARGALAATVAAVALIAVTDMAWAIQVPPGGQATHGNIVI